MITQERAAENAVETPAPAGMGAPGGKKKKKKGLSPALRRVIVIAIIVLAVAAVVFALWFFLFREKKDNGDIMDAVAQIGSIQSTVQGSGNARAGASAAITLTSAGTIEEVFVNVGDIVYEGQPLYTAFSPDAQAQVAAAEKAITDQQAVIEQTKKGVGAAEEALKAAEKSLTDVRKQYNELAGKRSELTIKAPFAGMLIDVQDAAVGTDLAAGTVLATLVNDRSMKLSLYFSYAYENDIAVGQAASVTVPSLMTTLQGKVEDIHKVRYISAEGGVFFEAVITVQNPGSLADGMEAGASILLPSGAQVYPYENGQLHYNGTTAIVATQTGKVTSAGSLWNYASVEAGQTLVVQSADILNQQISDFADTVEAAEKAVESAREGIPAAQQAVTDAEAKLTELTEALAEAQQGLENFNAVSPISGTITSCTVGPGSEVASGTTVITISDTTNMTVEITVDDRNIPFVTPGMMVELSDWNGMTYMGTVTNIDMSASESGAMGMTSYPVTLSVDNSDGSLLQGMWLDYSFVTSQSDECVMVPIQCVKSIVDTDGNPQTVVFLKSESRPDNAVDFEPPEEQYGGAAYPTGAEGYWPVPVETGLSDKYNVEIVSGLNAEDTVFSSYMMTGAYSY